MNMKFTVKTENQYTHFSSADFQLHDGLVITIDREYTEYDFTEEDQIHMIWHDCYLKAVNGKNLFAERPYINAAAASHLMMASRIVFNPEC